jgi:hypothetical protein
MLTSLLGLVAWLVVLFPVPKGSYFFFTKWGMESLVWQTLVGLQLVAGAFGITRKQFAREAHEVKVRRSLLWVFPLRNRQDDVVPDDAGAPLDIVATIEAQASATLTSQNTYYTFEGGRRVPTTETRTATFRCAVDGLFPKQDQHRVPFAAPYTYSVAIHGETLVRISAVDPWPCFEVEYRDTKLNTSQQILSVQPAQGDDPNKLDLVVSSLFRSAAWASLAELRLERGWLDIPHALWTPAEGFPDAEATGSPFRQRSGASADRWEWTMTEVEEPWMRRVGPFRDVHETTPERIVVRDGWLFAKEAGSGQVGSIPLDALREVTRDGEYISRFRFGRATDLRLPTNSEAAARLRELLEAQEAQQGAAHDVEAPQNARRLETSGR